jgi:hypothetical protein
MSRSRLDVQRRLNFSEKASSAPRARALPAIDFFFPRARALPAIDFFFLVVVESMLKSVPSVVQESAWEVLFLIEAERDRKGTRGGLAGDWRTYQAGMLSLPAM